MSVQFELPSQMSDETFNREINLRYTAAHRKSIKIMPDHSDEEIQAEKAQSKVAQYRAHTSGRQPRKDRSVLLQSKVNQNDTLKKTCETHSATCTCEIALLCKKVASRDERSADKATYPEALRHKEDLVEKFNNADAQVESVQNVAFSVFLGGLDTSGLLGVPGAAPPATGLTPGTNRSNEVSHKMTGILSNRLEGIVEL